MSRQYRHLDRTFLDILIAADNDRLNNINEELLDKLIDQEDPVTPTRPQQTPRGEPPYTQDDPQESPGAERYPTTNVDLKPSNKRLRVAVMGTPALRKVGFQNTSPESMGVDGLLFRWPADAQAKLHNAGVDFPVSAAFFDSAGLFRDHFHMLPEDGTPKQAKDSHRYALEVHSRDWASLGLGPGSQMSIAEEKDQSKNGSIQLGDDDPNEKIA